MKKIFLILALLLSVTAFSPAQQINQQQSLVRLLNAKGNVEMIFRAEDYANFKVENLGWMEGVISEIGNDHFVIHKMKIYFSDILKIDLRAYNQAKRTTGFVLMGVGLVSSILVATALFEGSGDNGWGVSDASLAVGYIGSAMFYGGLVTVLTRGRRVSPNSIWEVRDYDEYAETK